MSMNMIMTTIIIIIFSAVISVIHISEKKASDCLFFSLQEVPLTAPFHDSSQAEISGFRNNSSVASLALDPVSVARTLIRCPDDFYFGFYLLEVSVISITAGARRELAAL